MRGSRLYFPPRHYPNTIITQSRPHKRESPSGYCLLFNANRTDRLLSSSGDPNWHIFSRTIIQRALNTMHHPKDLHSFRPNQTSRLAFKSTPLPFEFSRNKSMLSQITIRNTMAAIGKADHI